MEVIDTFAWIEYFAGSSRGGDVRRFIEGGDSITPAIVIAEFTDKYVREKVDPQERLKFMRLKSRVLPLDDETAEVAGRISAERRTRVRGWGLVDSCVLATARVKGLKVVTGDSHFEDLSESIMI